MEQKELNALLEAVAQGQVSPAQAALQLRQAPFEDLALPNWTTTGPCARAWPR